jgi:hypothetical protein
MNSEYQNNTGSNGNKRLAVGGIHVIEREPDCRLESAQPPGAVKDLGWTGLLALEALAEGRATVVCGAEKMILEFASPVRLEITPADERDSLKLTTMERVRVRARLFDRFGNELEVGKFTHFEWSVTKPFEEALDRSAGEFGFCDTCYGMFSFHAAKPGTGTIEASLGSLRGELAIMSSP